MILKTHPSASTQSLQQLIEQAHAGQCIELTEGVYRPGTLVLRQGGESGNPLVIQAKPGHHVVLRGDAPLPGKWEPVDGRIWRMGIPTTYKQPVGDLFAGEDCLKEVADFNALEPMCWGYLQAEPFETSVACHDTHQRITTDQDGLLDLDQFNTHHGMDSSRHVLRTYIHVPEDCDGSLHLDNTRPIPFTGQWPMALVNDFYGYRRADEAFDRLKQPLAIYVNGTRQADWNQHSPLLKQVPWQAGWNELVIVLDAEPGRSHRFKLTVSTHNWNVCSKAGLAASLIQQIPQMLPDVENGLVLREFQWFGARPVGRRYVYVCPPEGQHPDNMDITASQHACLLTHNQSPCSHVVLRDLHFQRTATNPKYGMIDLKENAAHWRIEKCTFAFSTGGCINIETGHLHRITDCRFEHIGCTAIQTWSPQRFRSEQICIDGCTFSDCNSRGFLLGWHAACIKLCRASQCIVERCTMQDNACHGIWLDWECETNQILSNTIEACTCSGIFLEACRWNNKVMFNHITGTMVGPFGGNGIYMHDSCDAYIAHNKLENNADFGLRMGLATNRKMDYDIPIRRTGNVIIHNRMCHNGKAAMDIPQERPGAVMNHYDHNVYFPARFVLVHPDDIDKVFNAETGQSPVIRRFEIESLNELQQRTGQDACSTDQLVSDESNSQKV